MTATDMGERSMTTHSAGETAAFGARLGRSMDGGLCVGLVGPLGAGKTQFVRGVAAGLDVPADVVVNSPTFVIVNEYPGRLYIYHIDAYRLCGAEELSAVGFEEMVRDSAVVLVEWADRVVGVLPHDCLHVRFEHAGETVRRITLSARGERSRRALAALGASP